MKNKSNIWLFVAITGFLAGVLWGIIVHRDFMQDCQQPEPEIIYVQEKQVPLTDSTYMKVEIRTNIIKTNN